MSFRPQSAATLIVRKGPGHGTPVAEHGSRLPRAPVGRRRGVVTTGASTLPRSIVRAAPASTSSSRRAVRIASRVAATRWRAGSADPLFTRKDSSHGEPRARAGPAALASLLQAPRRFRGRSCRGGRDYHMYPAWTRGGELHRDTRWSRCARDLQGARGRAAWVARRGARQAVGPARATSRPPSAPPTPRPSRSISSCRPGSRENDLHRVTADWRWSWSTARPGDRAARDRPRPPLRSRDPRRVPHHGDFSDACRAFRAPTRPRAPGVTSLRLRVEHPWSASS